MKGDTHKKVDPRWIQRVTPELRHAVRAESVDGRIACAALRQLAESSRVPYRVAGAAADLEGVRVKDCDLGCF